uniref:Uncharacterized protein n=1 Tax=Rhizophora mucronata TaxID=61149 RepID=A0A2P2PJ33_RHIMU
MEFKLMDFLFAFLQSFFLLFLLSFYFSCNFWAVNVGQGEARAQCLLETLDLA